MISIKTIDVDKLKAVIEEVSILNKGTFQAWLRNVDAKIHILLGRSNGNYVPADGAPGWCVGGDTPSPVNSICYTSSYDAAMTLLPKELSPSLIAHNDKCTTIRSGYFTSIACDGDTRILSLLMTLLSVLLFMIEERADVDMEL